MTTEPTRGPCAICYKPADHSTPLCCNAHRTPLCHACYRRTHFVEVCDCALCGKVVDHA